MSDGKPAEEPFRRARVEPPRAIVPEGRPSDARGSVPFGHRRRGERYVCGQKALLAGTLGSIPVTIQNLSASGALLRVEDPRMLGLEQAKRSGAYVELLRAHASGGLVIELACGRWKVEVRLARWTSGTGGQDPYHVGIEFVRPLTPEELAAVTPSGS